MLVLVLSTSKSAGEMRSSKIANSILCFFSS